MKVYACKLKDDQIRQESTSGGAFSAIAGYILKKQGIVYGVYFDNDHKVMFGDSDHRRYSDFRGSKYPQADMGDIFTKIKKELGTGRQVLFVGTPCQVAGLKCFLGHDRENLLCIDFICFGVGSPLLWERYLEEAFPGQDIRNIRFKDKRNGWHDFSTVIVSDKGEVCTVGVDDPYMDSYLNGYNIRPSCYECRFKGTDSRASDITISDCWGIDHIAPEFDDNEGISGIYINNKKGKEIFSLCRETMETIEISFGEAVRYNPYYCQQRALPKCRDMYWKSVRKRGFLVSACLLRKKRRYVAMKNKLVCFLKGQIKRQGLIKRINNADVINLGSQYAFFDFFYEGLPIKGVNLANLPQYLDYDLKYIKKYGPYIKKHAKILIVLPNFVFAAVAKEMSMLNDIYYIKFWPWEIEGFSFVRWVKINFKRIKHRMKKILLERGGGVIEEQSSITDEQKIAMGEKRINGWKSVLGIPSMKDDDIPERIQKNIRDNVWYLDQIISAIKQLDCEPYIIVPPVSGAMNARISKICMDAYLFGPIASRRDQDVPVLNYLYDAEFQSLELYRDADCLTHRGARKFTQRVMQDIALL